MEYLILGNWDHHIGFCVLPEINKETRKSSLKKSNHIGASQNREPFNFNSISKYADTVNTDKFHRLSDQTIEDIDFYGLFEFIDRTSSKIGQQYLFKKLLEPTKNPVDPSESLIKLFTEDKQIRESIQQELSKLNNGGAYYITTLLQDKLLEKPKWFNLLF